MRIGIDVRLWNETGVGRYIRNLVSNLVKLDKKNEYVLFSRIEEKEHILTIIPSHWKIVTVSSRWHTVHEQLFFLAALYKEQLDLVHFPYFSLPVLYRRPFVVTIHDVIIHSFATGKASTLPLPLYYLKRSVYKKVIGRATRKAIKVIVPLISVKKEMREKLGVPSDKIVVTTEGFDNNIINGESIKNLPNKNYFLYVGNAYPHKNLERLIEGFLLFKTTQNSEHLLVLVGKDDYFYKQIEKKYKNDAILFLHKVSDSELGYLYNHAAALVSASLMEGFGLPCLEAAACGCLVAVSDIPAFREVCGENALFFSPHRVEDISSGFSDVLALSPAKRKAFILGGKRKAATYSWEKMTKETITIYEGCARIRSNK